MDLTNSPLNVSLGFLLIGTVIFELLLIKMPDERRPTQVIQDSTKPRLPIVTSPGLWRLWCGQVPVLVFFFVTLVMGSATSIVENLLFLYMRQDLKASYTMCGISVVITVLFEIPLFFIGKTLLKSVGILNLFLIGMTCYVTRVIAYTLIDVPWTVLLVEPLHGLTYATIQTASVSYIHSRCPKDRVAEGQGYVSLVRAIGQFMGTTVGSAVLQTFGSAVMYRLAAIFVTVAAVLLFIVFRRYGEEQTESIAEANAVGTDNSHTNNADVEMRALDSSFNVAATATMQEEQTFQKNSVIVADEHEDHTLIART